MLKLWDIKSGNEMHTFEGYSCHEVSLATTADGKDVVLRGHAGIIKLWDVESGCEMLQFVALKDDEWIVSTPDGDYNCSSGADKYFSFMPTQKQMALKFK